MPEPRPPIEFDLRLPGERHAPALARRVVWALGTNIPGSVLEQASLLTSELVTNAVRHAGLGARDTVALRIVVARRLRVEVTDGGARFRWGRLGAVDPARGHGGLGFLLVAELASSWGVETGPPTRVWFELDLRRAFDGRSARVSPHTTTTLREGRAMGDHKTDEAKGRAKEAAGSITGDDDMKREGKMDRAGATVKEKTGNAVDRTKEALNRDD